MFFFFWRVFPSWANADDLWPADSLSHMHRKKNIWKKTFEECARLFGSLETKQKTHFRAKLVGKTTVHYEEGNGETRSLDMEIDFHIAAMPFRRRAVSSCRWMSEPEETSLDSSNPLSIVAASEIHHFNCRRRLRVAVEGISPRRPVITDPDYVYHEHTHTMRSFREKETNNNQRRNTIFILVRLGWIRLG